MEDSNPVFKVLDTTKSTNAQFPLSDLPITYDSNQETPMDQHSLIEPIHKQERIRKRKTLNSILVKPHPKIGYKVYYNLPNRED